MLSFETPSTQEIHGDSGTITRGLDGNACGEFAIAEARDATLRMQDTSHCHECGDITSGSTIGGEHVQLCDGCIVAWVLSHVGSALVQEWMAEMA